jgi:invasion protein IalB
MFPHPDARTTDRPVAPRQAGVVLAAGLLAFCLQALGPAASRAHAETFGDWQLDCSSRDNCQLTTTGVEEQSGQPLYTLALRAGKAALSLSFSAGRARPDDTRAMQWEVDGTLVHVLRPEEFAPFGDIDRLYVTDTAAGDRLLAALRGGTRLRVSYLDAVADAHDAVFSLTGLTAGLQALGGAASGLDTARLAAPDTLAALARPSRREIVTALGIPYAVLERHARTSDCESTDSASIANAEVPVGVLGNASTLYAIPCTVSGNAVTYRLYMRDSGEIGGIETLAFALHDPRFGWVGTDLLTGVAYDHDRGLLTAEHVGRSDRVCGYRAAWRWQDYAFVMERFEGPAECRDAGNPGRWTQVFPSK